MGFFYPKNATDDGVYEISNGASDIGQIGRILKYQRAEKLDFWNSEFCNEIRGTGRLQKWFSGYILYNILLMY